MPPLGGIFLVVGEQNAVVVQVLPRAGTEALQQIVHGEALTLLSADVQHHPSGIHHEGSAAQLQGVFHVVGDHEAGNALPLHDFPGEAEHLLRRGRVQCGGVLVQQEQLGGHHGGHEQCQGLPLTAGEEAHRLAHPVLQAHVQPGELLPEERLVGLGDPAEEGTLVLGGAEIGQGQVLLDGHVGGGAPHGVLEQTADLAAAAVGGQIGDVRPVQADGALVHKEVPRHGVEEGGLARAVGAHDGHEVSLGQSHGQAVQGLLLVDGAGVEGLGDLVQFQHLLLPLSPGQGAALSGLESPPLPDGGGRDGQGHHQGGHQLEAVHWHHLGVKHQSVNETVEDAARHYRNGSPEHGAPAHDGLTDNQAGQADDHDSGAAVDVSCLLGLAHYCAGQAGEGVGHAQADGDGEIGVDGGGAHHVPVVAGGADAEAQPGAQEGHQQHTRQHGDPPGEEDGVPVAADAGGAEEGEDGILLEQGLVGLPAHGHEVYGIQPRVGDDARQDGGHSQLGLEEGGDKPGAGPGQHGGGDGQEGVSRGGEGHRHGAAQDETAVGGQVGDVQHPVA